MAELFVKDAEKWFRREDGAAVQSHRPAIIRGARRLCHGSNRSVGMRQIDVAQFHRRAWKRSTAASCLFTDEGQAAAAPAHRLCLSKPALAAVENHWRKH